MKNIFLTFVIMVAYVALLVLMGVLVYGLTYLFGLWFINTVAAVSFGIITYNVYLAVASCGK